jgi:hypothetical protein
MFHEETKRMSDLVRQTQWLKEFNLALSHRSVLLYHRQTTVASLHFITFVTNCLWSEMPFFQSKCRSRFSITPTVELQVRIPLEEWLYVRAFMLCVVARGR